MRLIHSLKVVNPTDPLVVMVHGRAFNMHAMKIFERVLPPEGVSRLYLQAPFEDPEGGYCWWNMFSKQKPEEGLSMLIDDLLGFREELEIRPSRSIAMGFSQGAAMLSGVIQRQPAMFDAVALLAGFVLQQDEQSAAQKPEVLMIHGTQDERVPLEKARDGFNFLQGQGYRTEFLENDVGHKVGSGGMRRLKEWAVHHLVSDQ